MLFVNIMYSTTLFVIAIGGATIFWLYTNKQQNEKNKVLAPKFDKPLKGHKLGGMLQNNVPNKKPNMKLFSNIEDRYIQAV